MLAKTYGFFPHQVRVSRFSTRHPMGHGPTHGQRKVQALWLCRTRNTMPNARENLRIYRDAERSAKPQLKNAIFGSKLSFLGLHYIVLQYILIASFASPGKLRAESLFTPPLQRLKQTALRFLLQRSNCMVWYDTCQCNCKSQLHHPFSNSETSLNSVVPVWMSSHNDMLHAFHSLPSVWVANHHHGPMLLPWLSSSRRKIAKPDLQVQVCRCARDEPGLTKAMGRRKRICIAAKRSQ